MLENSTVKTLMDKAEKAQTADEALKYSQAACNAANTLRVIKEADRWLTVGKEITSDY